MSVKFFGQFLLERGIVTREQLLLAIRLQESRNLRLGDYAVRRAYITEQQSDQINQAQLTTDKRFGELAVEMGLLTEEQVEELLTLQQNDIILLGEALLERDAIKRPILERELLIFKQDQSRYIAGEVIFPPGTPNASILTIVVDLTPKMLLRVLGLHCKLAEGENEERYPVDRLTSVTVRFSGSITFDYTLSVSKDVALLTAEKMLGAPLADDDEEEIVDSVKELCNVICGNAAAKCAQLGHRVEIGPPQPGAPQLGEDKYFTFFPVHMAEGAVEIRLLQ